VGGVPLLPARTRGLEFVSSALRGILPEILRMELCTMPSDSRYGLKWGRVIGALVLTWVTGLLVIGPIHARLEAPRMLDIVMRRHLHTDYRVVRVGEWQPKILIGDAGFSWKVELLSKVSWDRLRAEGTFQDMWRDEWSIRSVALDFGEEEALAKDSAGYRVFVADMMFEDERFAQHTIAR